MSAPDLPSQQLTCNLPSDGAASPLRIVLVTGEPLYREGLQAALLKTSSLLLLDATTIDDAAALALSRRADMAVIDANSFREIIEMARTLALRCPQLPVVAVLESATADEVGTAFEAGIRGCILKAVEAGDFVRILASIGQGALYLPPEFGAGLLRRSMGLNGANREQRRPYG